MENNVWVIFLWIVMAVGAVVFLMVDLVLKWRENQNEKIKRM